jgi:hypothetical protein
MIRKDKSNKMQQCIKIFIIPYLYEVQHVSGNTPQEPKTALTLSGTLCLTTSTNYTSNNLPHMKNQRLQVQF